MDDFTIFMDLEQWKAVADAFGSAISLWGMAEAFKWFHVNWKNIDGDERRARQHQ